MAIATLCCRLLMAVFLQTHPHIVDADFHILPNRLQLFEYEFLSFECLGYDDLDQCSILRKTNTEIESCGLWGVSVKSTCSIKTTYSDDSGEYWCEAGEGKRSNSVYINIAAGSVILESPALPVTEGDNATLNCRDNKMSSNLTTLFYKDGLPVESSSTGGMTIRSVSASDDGLYKCSISGAGESAESRLHVRVISGEQKETRCSSAPWMVSTVLLVVLLLLVGLVHFGKAHWHRASVEAPAVM